MLETLQVDNAAAAAALSNLRQRHLVLALVDAPRSQAQLGALLGIPLNLLHYHLTRLQALKLVEVAHSEARGGRAVRFYRATARAFFVPARLAEALPSAPMMELLRDALAHGLSAGFRGILYSCDDGPRMQIVRDATRPKLATDLWQDLQLDDATAKALIADLQALFETYAARGRGKGRRFIVHAAVAPRRN